MTKIIIFNQSMRTKGFTLVELMVVVAIVSLLSSIVSVSLSTARSKGRDAQRITEIRQLQGALELYYLQYGHYPLSLNCNANTPNNLWCNSVESLHYSGVWVRDSGVKGILVPQFITHEPIDPSQTTSVNWPPVGGRTYFYFSDGYGGSGQWYMIVYGLENPNNALESSDGVIAPNGTYFHYGNGINGIITVGRSTR